MNQSEKQPSDVSGSRERGEATDPSGFVEVIDISQPLDPQTAPWPGDEGFQPAWTARIETGSSVNIGAFRMSAHLGTHADAPLHFEHEGASTSTFPLSAFVGPVQVVSVDDDTIRPAHVEALDLEALDLEAAPRVLFKTKASAVQASEWSDDFPPILPETIEQLAARGVVLIGTDAPSVDPAESKRLSAHHALARSGIVNLENLALGDVALGRYWLSALPLKLEGMDAAPVRAVLLR